jgi:phosphoglycerol transferase MdoB-like AlkP superfamily enzyme
MFGRIKFLLLYFFSWVLFFEVARVLFLVYHSAQTKELSAATILGSLWHGMRMDFSMAAYLLVPVCLFTLAGVFVNFFKRPSIYIIYTCLLLFFIWFIILADLQLYSAWGFRIDATPLVYLKSPREVWASISHLPLFWIAVLFLATYIGFCFLFIREIRRTIQFQQSERDKLLSSVSIVLFLGLLIIPMRGGLQLAPLNQSSVYFSTNNYANQSAINAPWNFMENVVAKSAATSNPYVYMDSTEAKKTVDSLLSASGTYTTQLTTKRPNIILIVWESFTEKAIHYLIDGQLVTPRFNELRQEGLYFSHVYASGDRTDKGLPAVLSGYPAMNNTSVIRIPTKVRNLTVLPQLFKQQGYHATFYYGGEPEFANIKSYLLYGGFDPIVDINSFSKKDQNSKWGAHDGVVAQRLYGDLKKMPQPFFVGWLTLSSHEPYEIPTTPAFKGSDFTSKFLSALHYTDEVLYQFIQQCKQQPWWGNTLIVITGDHGHPLPDTKNREDNFKIPMLWLGGAVANKGDSVTKIVSQIDLARTLAAQTVGQEERFPFSKNIFDSTTKQWAFFAFNNGFGLMQPDNGFLFDNVSKSVMLKRGSVSAADIKTGEALQQFFYQDYLNR